MAFLLGGGGGTPYNAAEAVSPGGMSSQEWSATGATGGQLGSGGGDSSQLMARMLAGMAGAPKAGLMPGPGGPADSGGGATQVQPMDFSIVQQFLASLGKPAKSKGAR